jgi:large subunit ribosomal protein L25
VVDYTLNAQLRTIQGKKVSQLRNAGMVPGSLYGPKADPIKLQFQYRDLENTLKQAGGTHLIDVAVEGGKSYPVVAREVQRDILKSTILHVDFFAVDMNVKIRTEVPVIYEGESPLVTSRKAIMLTGPNTLTVELLPSHMVDRIHIDVSQLDEMGATIFVKDLDLGEAVILNDPEEMIAKIVQPSAVRAEEALDVEGETATVPAEEDEE